MTEKPEKRPPPKDLDSYLERSVYDCGGPKGIGKESSQTSKTSNETSKIFDFEEDEVDVDVPAEDTIVLMPLDPTDVGLYCIYYYLKHLHKPKNNVCACYVSDDFKKSTQEAENEEMKKPCCPSGCCRKGNRKFWNKVVVDVGPSPGVLSELRKMDHVNCMRVKHRVKHLFNKMGVKWEFRRLRGTDPGETILEHAKNVNCQMIVIGSRGPSQLSRSIFGSVSEKVVQNAKVPVLVIRKPCGAMESETANCETAVN